ncbi:hypothetical protein DXG03_005300 [Asterophora parasitica]|uniref:Pentacotripeptide-repeat region of PRORP domain-containing protein n=1 Tax=Asterophora parasitica TaxID=117018 RepID=A0A9P7KCN8_9AGAR|nr:hypothetical protein DXG03_005300 [Asterophora parasitica]
MLPKVATHILHTSTRAVASIQQTYTIRNVLQFQSNSGPSSTIAPWNNTGSSHWGNNGPGPGGAKYNTGSRHYNYAGAGRAVTQANTTISSSDGSYTQSTDETDDIPPRRAAINSTKRTRIRSSSLSIPNQGRKERGEKLGVLKTVQLHTRSRHVFAPQTSTSPQTVESIESAPRPVLVRRNSTSAPLPTSEIFDPSIPAPSPKTSRRNSAASRSASPVEARSSSPPPPESQPSAAHDPLDPKSPQTTTAPKLPSSKPLSPDTIRLRAARDSGNHVEAAETVRHFLQTTQNPTVREFNGALEALAETRRVGEPLHLILETYNDMLRRSLMPNASTYVTLIDALCARDSEIHRVIHTLETRVKHRKLTGRNEVASDHADKKRIELLRSETNFQSAMSMFEAILVDGGNHKCTVFTYQNLLRSCAIHGSIDGAIHVFAQVEKRAGDFRPTPSFYQSLIQAFTNAGQLKGAEEVFAEYREAIQRGDLHINWNKDAVDSNRGNLLIWNQMIETYFRFNLPDKAVGLVDQMLGAEADETSVIADPPPVGTSTFTTVLSGFCQTGDVETALVWFDRLLQQNGTTEDPFETTGVAMKPDAVAWSVMLDALAVKGMIHDLNRLFVIRLQDSPNKIRPTERRVVFAANLANVDSMNQEQFIWSIDFLRGHVLASNLIASPERVSMARELIDTLFDRQMYEYAVTALSEYVASWMEATSERGIEGTSLVPAIHTIQSLQLEYTTKLYDATQGKVSYSAVLQLARIADTVRVLQQEEYIPYFLQSYATSRAAGSLPVEEMTLRDWELLMYAAVEVQSAATSDRPLHTAVPDYAFEGLVSLLGDLAKYKVAFNDMNPLLIKRTVSLIVQERGQDAVKELFQTLGPAFQNVLEDPELAAAALESAISESASEADSGYASAEFNYESTKLRIDPYTTKTVHAEFKALHNPGHNALNAFAKFRRAVESGKAPNPATIGLLIQSLGRASRMEEVHYAYTVAQTVLASLETNKAWQADAWFQIEDSMIIGLAHHGDVEGAHVHRLRILEQGGAPTADAYGALIYNVKDTTDDTSNAMALFQESQQQRVVPNQYLYNNIISKLAKARKADYALELFQQMKSHVAPSSVTYGAVIGACARVGDIHSAEMLFKEMQQAKNFKPRVPPYNTMMQMYTTTKPDRERALHYYHELCKAGIHPTAYTYKLLMDAYGAIEPVDIESMERTFKTLQEDRGVQVLGNHFASLINAYGCVQKDLDKAIEVFNSIASSNVEADALVFESMINALVAHRRTDLIPEYIAKMDSLGVKMTAYISNFLIKGYAIVGDIEQARSIFDSLEDPPVGMAAPNNHSPHDLSAPVEVDQSAPVYREPSTWEAMIRAELGSGNRDGAIDLLERLKARQYPEAVYNRISGILVDHSQVLP